MICKIASRKLALLILVLIPAVPSFLISQEGQISFDVSGSIDWIRGEMNTQASFDLAAAGIRLPTGRFMGEEILRQSYIRLLRPPVLSIRVDSNSTVRNLVDRGEIFLEQLDALSAEAEKIPPSLSADLARMNGRYKMFMEKVSSLLTLHRRALEPEKPLLPVPAADYTGIIIIADEQIPVRGRMGQALMEPCLFPKIWDTNMSIVYERNMFDPGRGFMVRYALRESIFRPTPSGLDGELAALVGLNPLRILAREAFGINPTDPVIDREDALKILSTENNRRLLREGRVVLVLSERMLKTVL